MSPAFRIEALRRQLADIGSLVELEATMLAIAPQFHHAVRRRTLIGRREDLGLRVVSLEMPYQGLAALGEADPLVALNRGSNSIRRRQTLAHECGHGLLRDVDRVALKLTREKEDILCSRFARLALMPWERVERYLMHHGFPADMGELHLFCHAFKASVRAAIAVLNEHGSKAGPVVLIAATYRAHEKRPNEFDFRVDVGASHPELFLPRDRRLVSMGLSALCGWAEGAPPGAHRSGRESQVSFRARARGARSWRGSAPWEARVYKAATGHQFKGARSLVISLDRSELRRMWGDPTARSRSRRPVSRLAGQIELGTPL